LSLLHTRLETLISLYFCLLTLRA